MVTPKNAQLKNLEALKKVSNVDGMASFFHGGSKRRHGRFPFHAPQTT
jgi:hypothetical protein